MDTLAGRLRYLREKYVLFVAPLLIILGVSAGKKPDALTLVATALLILLTISWLAGFLRPGD